MKRWMSMLLKFMALVVIYLAVLMAAPPQYNFMIYCFPLHALVTFGCFSLARIGVNLITISK